MRLEVLPFDGDARAWTKLLSGGGPVPLEQTAPYGAMVESQSAWQLRRVLVADSGVPVAAGQIVWQRRFGITLARLLRGPVPLAADVPGPALLKPLFDLYAKPRLEAFFVSPPFGTVAELAALGRRRVMTGYATAWLDPQSPLKPTASFKDGLRRGEKNKLRVASAHGGAALMGFLARYAEARRSGKWKAPSAPLLAALVEALDRPQDALLLIAAKGSDPVAGMLTIINAGTATYHASWVGAEGRQAGAMPLLMARTLEELRQRGLRHFDLGGLNDDDMAGVTRFKLSLNPTPQILPGTYL